MYNRNYWQDEVEDQSGTVIQEGTLLDQAHFNPMEVGISDATLAGQIDGVMGLQKDYENLSEVHEVTITANSNPWPFCNSEKAVALTNLRNTTNYTADVSVKSYSGGRMGDVRILDKALNGFKILLDGSATTVTLSVKITGGMIA